MTLKYRVNIESDSLDESFEVEGGMFYIGRSDQADITIKNALFSRKHIKVKSKEGSLYVQDLDTTNGTRLNGKNLDPHEWYEFTDNDEIKVGQEISIYIESLVPKEKSKVININEISNQHRSSDSITAQYQIPSQQHETLAVGSAAVNLDKEYEQEKASSNKTGVYYTEELKSVLNRVEDSPQAKFSEIELLEIKRIEIESQVKALKIKEESEQEAFKILERAKQEAQSVLHNAHEKSVQMLDSVEDKRDSMLAKAKRESGRLLKETMEACNEEKKDLEEKISELKLDIDYLKKDKTEAFQKLENINNDISEALKQKQNLELRSDSIRDKVLLVEQELEEVVQKQKSHEEDFDKQKDKLDEIKFDHGRFERENKNLLNEKEKIISEVEILKDKESQLLTSIDKNQERLDKFFDIKEEISQENKRLEEKLEVLQTTEQSLASKIEDLNEQFRIKDAELSSISEKAKNHFHQETQKYNADLEKRKNEEEERFQKLKQENDERSSALVSETKERVEKMELEAYELLEQAKKAETEAKAMQEKALNDYQETLVSAKEKTQKLVDMAQITAEEKIEEAKVESKELFQSGRAELQKAQEKATELVRLAQEKSAQVHADALKNLEVAKEGLVKENELLKRSNRDLTSQKTKLKMQIDQFSDQLEQKTKELEKKMLDQKHEMLETTRQETSALKEKAHAELKEIQEKVQKLEESQLKEVELSIAEKHRIEREKFELQLKKERETIAQLKAKEITKLKKLQDVEDDKIAKRKKEYLDVITTGVLNAVNMKIKELAKKKVLGENAAIDEQNVRNLIKSALLDEKPEKNQLLKKLKAKAGDQAGRSLERTKKMAIGFSAGLFVIVLAFIFSEEISSVSSGVKNAMSIKKSSRDLYIQDLNEREKYLAQFNPEQTKDFKTNYTDNILYTEKFLEIYASDEFRSKWTIAFRDFLVNELDRPPTNSVVFITDEKLLLINLIDIRKIIRKDTKEARIQEMRQLEEQRVQKLIDYLGGQENYILLQDFAGEFFTKYRNGETLSGEY